MDKLSAINEKIHRFAEERDWQQFHTPKNLSMAIAAEVGELLEPLQWLSTEESLTLSARKKQQVTEEIADIGIYLLRLCQVVDVDLVQAMADKIELNAIKYPVHKAKGNASKYDSFD